MEDAALPISRKDDLKTQKTYQGEESVDAKVREAREKRLKRFYGRICRAEAGPIFLEMLINLERMSDHCQNIAEYV